MANVEPTTAVPAETADSDEATAWAIAWLERFSACVRARDFKGGRALFAPEAHGFGTVVEQARDLGELEAGQWRRVWHETRGFRVLDESPDVLLSEDGTQACVLARWESQGTRQDGSAFSRRGRCTVVLRRDPGAPCGWKARHTHFSKRPPGDL